MTRRRESQNRGRNGEGESNGLEGNELESNRQGARNDIGLQAFGPNPHSTPYQQHPAEQQVVRAYLESEVPERRQGGGPDQRDQAPARKESFPGGQGDENDVQPEDLQHHKTGRHKNISRLGGAARQPAKHPRLE